MHLVRIDLAITPGRAVAFESWVNDLAQVTKHYEGFHFAVLANSLGSPVQYTSIQRWESREAFMAFFRGEKLTEALGSALGTGLFQIRRPPEIYENVWRVGDPSATDFKAAALVEWSNVSAGGRAQAFEKDRHVLAELRQRHVPGFVAYSLWRNLGNPGRYVVAQAYQSVAALSAARTAPEVQAYMQAHPATDYTTAPIIENFDVVLRVNR